MKPDQLDSTCHDDPKSSWDANADDQKVMVQAGPNNPVGVACIDLSKDHYGIQATPDRATIDRSRLHGCIRLMNRDVASLMQVVAAGTAVVMEE